MAELSDLTKEFLQKIEDESSLNTLKAYKGDLGFLQKSFSTFSQINESSLRDIRVKLIENYSPSTVSRRWSAWREFFRYCQIVGVIRKNPIWEINVESFNKQREFQENLSDELIEAICNFPSKIRDKALLWFLYSTGVRPSELFQFGSFKNLNLAAKEFYVDNRITFLSEYLVDILEQYLVERQLIMKTKTPGLNEAIFINEQGQPLKETYIYTVFSQAAQNLGLKSSVGDLRDSLMLRLYRNGASPEGLKYLLGFKSIKSIEPLLRSSK
ncbi:MAG: tyrosine-type recombinase/integrase [Candidatus Caenarcaniphilales bacterium]|nr:tyrosine-type recombinase/integrase [Candidatus Caenarcaniphilales bacterium]